jgi:hypothetical protein
MPRPMEYIGARVPLLEGQSWVMSRPWYMWMMSILNTLTAAGDVFGPSSSVNNQIVLFNGTTGTLIKGATGTGFVFATNGVYSVTTDLSQVGYWSELTNGDPVSPELVFDSFGDTIAVWTPTP